MKMNSKEILEKIDKYEAQGAHSHQLPVVWDRASEHFVLDINNERYLDFSSTIFVTNCGHSRNYKAIIEQAKKSLIHCYNFPSQIKAELCEKLISITPEFCEKVAFFSAGTEATEVAIKIMKMNLPGYICSIKGAMHGKTYLTEQLKENGKDWRDFTYFISNIRYPEKDKFFHCFSDPINVSGFIIESYEGWSGRFLPKKWVQDLVKFANENKIPVCFDEIQGGFGRTGKMFAYEHYEVEPDLICIGKGFGGGLPISAVLGRKELIDLPSDISSTNSGNSLCCAGALENITYFHNNDLITSSYVKGQVAEKELMKMKETYKNFIKELNCYGLMIGIIFPSAEIATEICYKCLEKKLIVVHTNRESIKLGPPLTINVQDLLTGLKIFEQSIREVYESRR